MYFNLKESRRGSGNYKEKFKMRRNA